MTGIFVPVARAKEWVASCLQAGGPLATALLTRVPDFGSARLLVPPHRLDLADGDLDHWSRRVSRAESLSLAAMLLAERYCNAGLFVVIEDDMRRRGDPRIPDFAGSAGDRVVWHDAITSERTERAAELLGDGAAGYPTNACVAGFFPAQSELEPADLARIAESAVALIASVYDAESFVVLEETSGTASTIAVAADER